MTSGGISEAVMVVKVPAALIKVRTPSSLKTSGLWTLRRKKEQSSPAAAWPPDAEGKFV